MILIISVGKEHLLLMASNSPTAVTNSQAKFPRNTQSLFQETDYRASSRATLILVFCFKQCRFRQDPHLTAAATPPVC